MLSIIVIISIIAICPNPNTAPALQSQNVLVCYVTGTNFKEIPHIVEIQLQR